MSEARTLAGWVKISHLIPGISENHILSYNLQSIGKLDLKLSKEWEEIKHFQNSEYVSRFDQHSFLCALWVMGAYEIMRILKKLQPTNESKRVYELFRRVRIPLVKFETCKTNGLADYPYDFGIAMLAIQPDTKNLGWAIGPTDFISRDQLADALYNLYIEIS